MMHGSCLESPLLTGDSKSTVRGYCLDILMLRDSNMFILGDSANIILYASRLQHVYLRGFR